MLQKALAMIKKKLLHSTYPTVHPQSIRNIADVSKIFVYGTLKRNEPDHAFWLKRIDYGKSVFLTEGATVTKYPLVIATRNNSPFLLFKPGTGYHVKGEIYEVDDKMLSKIDELASNPVHYERQIEEIQRIRRGQYTPEVFKCWVYFLKKFKAELLDLPYMESYSSSGRHGKPYVQQSKRDPNYNATIDLM